MWGNAFAVEPTLHQSAYFRPPNRDRRLAGLYFAGGGTHPGAGMPGVLLGAEVTAGLSCAADRAARAARRGSAAMSTDAAWPRPRRCDPSARRPRRAAPRARGAAHDEPGRPHLLARLPAAAARLPRRRLPPLPRVPHARRPRRRAPTRGRRARRGGGRLGGGRGPPRRTPRDRRAGADRRAARRCRAPPSPPSARACAPTWRARRSPREADVDRYCYRVAGTVGEVMAAVLGTRDAPRARPAAAALGHGDAAHEHPARHRRGRRGGPAVPRPGDRAALRRAGAGRARGAAARPDRARRRALRRGPRRRRAAAPGPRRGARRRVDVPRDPAPDRARRLRRAARPRGRRARRKLWIARPARAFAS